MELIQNAYQGFAKDNFTMLDNLKLGYGGTAGEMARLINDSGVLGDAIEVTNKTVADVPFDKVIEAINVIQTRMGITGTTAKEAGRTIAGSVGSMKAAWTNLVTGFADGNADIETLIENLVETIVGDGTENNLGVIGNVLPAIETALGGIAKLIEGAAPKIIEILPGLVTRIVPSLISAATNMVDAVIKVVPDLLNTVVDALIDNAPALITAAIGLVQSLIQGIQDNYQILVDGAIQIVAQLATGILNMLPQIIALGLDLIISLANGIAESLPTLIPTIIDVILQIVDTLTSPEQLTNLLNAALVLVTELAFGLTDAIPQLVNAINQIVMNIGWFLTDPKNIAMILDAALKIIVALGTGVLNAIPVFLKNMVTFYSKIFENFKNVDWGELGRNLVDGFKNGISRAWTSLKKWFKNLFGDLIGIAKKLLGIASPSKVFKKLGSFTADGFGIGFKDEFAHVKDDMEDALDFEDASVGINASIRRVGAGAAGGAFGGTSIGNININIDGAKYSDEQSLASAIALEIQNMTDRRAAVYA
jgi:phage-related protein